MGKQPAKSRRSDNPVSLTNTSMALKRQKTSDNLLSLSQGPDVHIFFYNKKVLKKYLGVKLRNLHFNPILRGSIRQAVETQGLGYRRRKPWEK